MRHTGRITQWKDDEGYGFIKRQGGGPDVFFHISSMAPRQPRPLGNETVSFALCQDVNGRWRADQVTYSGKSSSKATGARWHLSSSFALIYLVIGGGMGLAGQGPAWLWPWYGVVSIATFVAYAVDKSAARNGHRRIPENTLQLLSVSGGWPGALMAQDILRHKSLKRSFRVEFWSTVILNLALTVWLMTHDGEELWKSLIS